jgi:hypothetical protein
MGLDYRQPVGGTQTPLICEGAHMSTKVFISWSGPLSQKLGEALRTWLPSALQFVKPYFTPDDIEKGAKWGSEISKELETSNIGIICLTRDNTEQPWILFEAGALSKSLQKSRVCPLLFGVEPSDVKGPLLSFQVTRFLRDDFKRLVTTINSAAGESQLDTSVLNSVFDKWWPELDEEITEILKSSGKGAEKELRSDRDILEEILERTRLLPSVSPSARVDGRSLEALVQSLIDFQDIVRREQDQIGSSALERLLTALVQVERPLRRVCADAGKPELHDVFGAAVASLAGELRQTLRNRRDDDISASVNRSATGL